MTKTLRPGHKSAHANRRCERRLRAQGGAVENFNRQAVRILARNEADDFARGDMLRSAPLDRHSGLLKSGSDTFELRAARNFKAEISNIVRIAFFDGNSPA